LPNDKLIDGSELVRPEPSKSKKVFLSSSTQFKELIVNSLGIEFIHEINILS
jgi:hypothetical protein